MKPAVNNTIACRVSWAACSGVIVPALQSGPASLLGRIPTSRTLRSRVEVWVLRIAGVEHVAHRRKLVTGGGEGRERRFGIVRVHGGGVGGGGVHPYRGDQDELVHVL